MLLRSRPSHHPTTRTGGGYASGGGETGGSSSLIRPSSQSQSGTLLTNRDRCPRRRVRGEDGAMEAAEHRLSVCCGMCSASIVRCSHVVQPAHGWRSTQEEVHLLPTHG